MNQWGHSTVYRYIKTNNSNISVCKFDGFYPMSSSTWFCYLLAPQNISFAVDFHQCSPVNILHPVIVISQEERFVIRYISMKKYSEIFRSRRIVTKSKTCISTIL